MKRILLLLLVLALAFTSVPSYATQVSGSDGTAQSTIYCTIESQFCVVIPKNIDCMNPFRFTAEQMNLLDSQQVNVYINGENRVQLYNDSGDTINVEFYSDAGIHSRVASFTDGMLESINSAHCQPITSEGELKAGNYTGTVEFLVRLEDRDI